MRVRAGSVGLAHVGIVTALTLTLNVTGCDADTDTASWGTESTPNAEIRVPEWSEIPERTLSADPDLRIGENEETGLLFHRLDEVRGRDDGSLIVADGGDLALYVFDSGGAVQEKFGAAGFGPGEFRRIAGVVPVGEDSLLVFDPASLRLTWFDREGAVLETIPVQPPEGSGFGLDVYRLADVKTDGSVLLVPRGRVVRSGPEDGVRRERRPVLRLSASGELLGALTAAQEREIFDGAIGSMDIPHGDHTSVVAGAGRIVEAEHRTGRIRVWADDGSVREIALALEPRPMDPRVRGAWMASFTDRIEDRAQRLQAEAMLADVPFPDIEPQIERIYVGRDGALWISPVDLTEPSPVTWIRLDPEGRAVERVSLPRDLRPQVIDSTQVVGIRRDSLGVHSVRRYRWIGDP